MFQENLDVMDNIALKERLLKITPEQSKQGITYCVTPTGEYVLLKNELSPDDLQNPRETVRQTIKNTIKNEMKSNDIIIAFGLGLGYLLDELYTNFPSKIFIYEPDLEFLHFALSNMDISEHLASGRVYITNDLSELISKLSDTYLTKDKVEIVYLKNYAIIKNKELLLMTQKVYDTCKSKIVDVNTITKFSKEWLVNTLDNITTINSKGGYLLSDLENKFEGQTALIAGAGPSLNDNIAKIKMNRGKLIIIAANKVVKYLISNDIIPDFVVCLDARNMETTLGDVSSKLSETNCIMDIRTDRYIKNIPFKKVFYNFSDSDVLIKNLQTYNSFMKFYETGGSATTFALAAAFRMGFSKIILAGIDLAFKDTTIYADGQEMNKISDKEMCVDAVNKNIVQIPSINGEMVSTREDYQVFIEHFNAIIKNLNASNVYNISSFGALINGVHNVSFDAINIIGPAVMFPVNDTHTFKLNTENCVKEELCKINDIISNLSTNTFSPALVSLIVKSPIVYQYMQADILNILQSNFEPSLAESFIDKTKNAVKIVVDLLQKNGLI